MMKQLPPLLGPSFTPMAPISIAAIPEGKEWLHQLKWDGIRLLAEADGQEKLELYTRKMEERTASFYTIQQALLQHPSLREQRFVLDGEAIVMDPVLKRPSFPLILKRQRTTSAISQRDEAIYVVFDILHWNGEDLRQVPYEERHQLLLELFPDQTEYLLVTDAFEDGEALWAWVETHEWEGVVSKRRHSFYQEAKRHQDWFKHKKSLELQVLAIGYIEREGRVASLVISQCDGSYVGRVSIGLNEQHRSLLQAWCRSEGVIASPFGGQLPSDLRKERVIWFKKPIPIEVTALEWTDAGVLRHPKLVSLPARTNTISQ
ncbi:RNA ligase family protein [Paenibacillus sp. 1001270B_150601_E10]|uniref:ATP-dependent DNA ligase n=1 Tax=Paenibacillus sp. 1001270B_150601_E10 TaxID=2787079 RepID=UPI00189D2F01|nr:RNA ligase family protein [Paenibacillus sp. 1001270B_150601_E10]